MTFKVLGIDSFTCLPKYGSGQNEKIEVIIASEIKSPGSLGGEPVPKIQFIVRKQ